MSWAPAADRNAHPQKNRHRPSREHPKAATPLRIRIHTHIHCAGDRQDAAGRRHSMGPAWLRGLTYDLPRRKILRREIRHLLSGHAEGRHSKPASSKSVSLTAACPYDDTVAPNGACLVIPNNSKAQFPRLGIAPYLLSAA